MTRDVLILGKTLLFIERAAGDVTVTKGTLICENDWKLLVGEPNEEETFDQLEKKLIIEGGWEYDDRMQVL